MNQLPKLLTSLTTRQQLSIVAVASVMILGLWGGIHWNRERSFRPLYTSLSAEDAGAVVQKLREKGVEYRLDETGGTIRVPSDKVADARLQIAAAGLPKTGRIGFELFDQTNFGLTEFAEQVNFRRAIEGELERSIMSLSEIERARVHISLPKDSVFLESRQEAKASVIVKLRPGARLSAQNGAAVCHLVASAVDRLSPQMVTVVDTTGALLVRPRKAPADGGMEASESSLDYQQKLERDLVQKINATLEPLLGADKFRASASVDCDFSATELQEESFDPTHSVMTTAQKSEDMIGAPQVGGAPGTASNLPRPADRAASSQMTTTRRTENISYQSSKSVKHTRLPQGSVKRMSLAVLLDQNVRWEGSGSKSKRVVEAPSPEKLKTIRELVAAATGLSTQRGDQLIVESLAFESTLTSEPPDAAPAPGVPAARQSPLPVWLQNLLAKWMPKSTVEQLTLNVMAGTIGGALLALLMLLAFLLLRRKARVGAVTDPALPAGEEPRPSIRSAEDFEAQMASRQAERERLESEALRSLSLPAVETKKSEVLAKHLRESAKKEPVAMAHLLRTWMNDREE